MTEQAGEIANAIGAGSLEGMGALGLYWVAGPTVRAVGQAFGSWTEWRLNNLLKLGEKIENRHQQSSSTDGDEADQPVHPRVIHEVFDRGSWTDDPVSQEYLAGLVTSARSPGGREDESAYLASIVAGMSTIQIRLHHAIYSPLNGHGPPQGTALEVQATAKRYTTFVPYDEIYDLMGLPAQVDSFVELRSAIAALARDGLIGAEYGVGGPGSEYLRSFFPPGVEGGMLTYPTPLGIEIFARAYGLKISQHNHLLTGLRLPHLHTEMPTAPGALVGVGTLS